MTLTLQIPDDLAQQLQKQAESLGSAPELLAVAAIRRQMQAEEQLDRVLTPVREAFEASGMTEDELSDLLEQAKHEMRAERRARQSS
jgi:predicted transcriptional regulator